MIIDKLKDLLQPANAAESEKANEAPRLDQKALCQLLETTLTSIGCTPTWEDERDQSRVASYEYQGGNFLVRIAKDDTFLRLCYPIFLSVDKELVELVREICNQVNLASIGLRAVYTFDEDHLHVNVHFFDNLYLEPSRAKGMLTQSMKEMFSWRDAFVRWMDTVKEKRKKYGANSPEDTEEQCSRLLLMIREHELEESEATMPVRENAIHHITLSELVEEAVGIKLFVPSFLSVSGDGLSLVMDASQDAQLRSTMADYVLSDALVSDGKFVRRCATLQLVFFQIEDPDERRYLTVSLVARETSPEALFFQTTVVLTPRLATLENPADCVNDHPTACSLLMAYDLKNEKQLRDEFQYMWTDAKDKLAHGQIDKMTEEQRAVARVKTRSLAGALYRGSQLFQSKRFFEAMLLLRNAFVLWRGSVDQLSSKERGQFYEVCFMLGYCYDEMRQYDIGHYYLSLLDGTDNIAHVWEMVNNLANNNDPRVIGYIESLLNDIQRRYEEETGKHVNVYQAAQDSEYCVFAAFLLATRVTIYSMRACYQKAALELHEISKYPELSDQVREVMRRIDRNRSNPDEAPFAPPADC